MGRYEIKGIKTREQVQKELFKDGFFSLDKVPKSYNIALGLTDAHKQVHPEEKQGVTRYDRHMTIT